MSGKLLKNRSQIVVESLPRVSPETPVERTVDDKQKSPSTTLEAPKLEGKRGGETGTKLAVRLFQIFRLRTENTSHVPYGRT